jgi:hypothetical protein
MGNNRSSHAWQERVNRTPPQHDQALDRIYSAPDFVVAANLETARGKSPVERKRAVAPSRPGSREKTWWRSAGTGGNVV